MLRIVANLGRHEKCLCMPCQLPMPHVRRHRKTQDAWKCLGSVTVLVINAMIRNKKSATARTHEEFDIRFERKIVGDHFRIWCFIPQRHFHDFQFWFIVCNTGSLQKQLYLFFYFILFFNYIVWMSKLYFHTTILSVVNFPYFLYLSSFIIWANVCRFYVQISNSWLSYNGWSV